MSSFGRRDDGSHEDYLIEQQIELPIPYGSIETHHFGPSGTYQLPQHSINPYTAQFSSPYSQQALYPNIQHLASQCSSGPSELSTNDPARLQQQHLPYVSQTQSRYLHSPKYRPLQETISDDKGLESQESQNENTMLSEPIIPPLDGFPDARTFDRLINSYIEDLSIKKRDKALIHARRARNIRRVLIEPKNTAVESAQFRFWVKKMFKLDMTALGSSNCPKILCHEGKPVAVREKLFKILTKAHQQCQHGGRDKTSAQVRRIYSWVPKELISRFVKICPTCQIRRGGLRITPPSSRKSTPQSESISHSPSIQSPFASRRESMLNTEVTSQEAYLDQFDNHHFWMNNQHVDERQTMNPSQLRSFGDGTLNSLPHVPTVLDPFASDVTMPPSQMTYNPGYTSSHPLFKP